MAKENTKTGFDFRELTKKRLFLPIVCLVVVLLTNLIKTPNFFSVSVANGVLNGYIIDVINRASELVILAIGMTLVTAASGGQDISVGAVMAVAAAACCQILTGGFIGGTLLSGGVGTVIGTLFGVLIKGTITSLITTQGTLSSWWVRITLSALLCFFIVPQAVFASMKKKNKK